MTSTTMTVLVTGAQTPAGSSMAQALTGETLNVLACNTARRPSHLSVAGEDPGFAVHASDDPEFVGDLLSLCLRHDVDVLVPTAEREQVVLARVREVFERLGTQVWLAPTPAHATRSQARRIAHACSKSRTRFAMSQWFSRMTFKRGSTDDTQLRAS